MKKIQLDEEEKQILRDYEKGEFGRIPNYKEEIKKYQEAAKNTINKTKNINIRLSLRDLARLKQKAAETGLPYQTLAALVLRQYTDKKISISL